MKILQTVGFAAVLRRLDAPGGIGSRKCFVAQRDGRCFLTRPDSGAMASVYMNGIALASTGPRQNFCDRRTRPMASLLDVELGCWNSLRDMAGEVRVVEDENTASR
jgi:hypothetical protein